MTDLRRYDFPPQSPEEFVRGWLAAFDLVDVSRAEATAAAEQRLRAFEKVAARARILASYPLVGAEDARQDLIAALRDVWPPNHTPPPASPRQGEEARPARCVEEGCVRTPGHVGAHTSRPYWPRELRDELALEPFTKVVVGIYDPATQQTETIVGDSASPRQGEPLEHALEATTKPPEDKVDWRTDRAYLYRAGWVDRGDAIRAALSEPAEAGMPG